MRWADAAIAGLLNGAPLALLAVAVGIAARWAGSVLLPVGVVGITAALLADALRPVTELGAVANGVGAALAAFLVGVLVQLGLVSRRAVLGDVARPPIAWLAVTVAAIGLVSLLAGDGPVPDRVEVGRTFVPFGGPTIVGSHLVATIVALVVLLVLGLAAHSQRTLPMRVASDDPAALARIGRDPRLLLAAVMGVSAACAALGGVLTAEVVPVERSAGLGLAVVALEAAAIGSVGSFPGALLGGLVLGLTRALGAELGDGWGEVAGHAVTIAIVAATHRRALRRVGSPTRGSVVLTGFRR